MGFSLITLVFSLLSFLPLCLHFLLKKIKGNHDRFFFFLINKFVYFYGCALVAAQRIFIAAHGPPTRVCSGIVASPHVGS